MEMWGECNRCSSHPSPAEEQVRQQPDSIIHLTILGLIVGLEVFAVCVGTASFVCCQTCVGWLIAGVSLLVQSELTGLSAHAWACLSLIGSMDQAGVSVAHALCPVAAQAPAPYALAAWHTSMSCNHKCWEPCILQLNLCPWLHRTAALMVKTRPKYTD